MKDFLILFFIISLCFGIPIYREYVYKKKIIIRKARCKNLSEWSYQRFSRFFGQEIKKDIDCIEKFDNIISEIKRGERDVKVIAENTGCSLNETIMKIDYLKNKRVLDRCYVDKQNNILLICTTKDAVLIKKYTKYLYYRHSTIEEIVLDLPGTTLANKSKVYDKVLEELKYLCDNKLVNGVILNEVDKKLVYYTVEKHVVDLYTLNCPNCGALVDVNKGSKARCKFCDTIVEGKM